MKKEEVIIRVIYKKDNDGDWGYETSIEGTAEQIADSMLALEKGIAEDEELTEAIEQYRFEKSLKMIMEKLHKKLTEGNDATKID